MERKYCVTAISRLSDKREIVSVPCSKAEAEKIRARLMATKPGNRPYTRPEVSEYPQQLNLFTKQLDV